MKQMVSHLIIGSFLFPVAFVIYIEPIVLSGFAIVAFRGMSLRLITLHGTFQDRFCLHTL